MDHPTQHTVAGEVSLQGTGVHSGESAVLTLHPAPPGTGRRFRRSDVDGSPEIPADLDHVVDTELGTTLGRGEVRVHTVEHVLAALSAGGVDNVVVDLTGPEPPIRDGSFQDYLDLVVEAGRAEQEGSVPVLEIRETVTVRDEGGEHYVATPGAGFTIAATIDFPHPAIGRQFGSFLLTGASFREELGPARTFGFREDARALQARGLARGAALENTVVLDEDGVMNEGGLRFADEFLRHKVGDMVGDLALLGRRIRGHVVAERPSHRGNVALARALAEQHDGGGPPIVDIHKIMQYLPHRFPMLLVDRIVDFESGKRIVGIKNVTINEPFFQGHFPGHPIMPGVLIIEAMGQVGGLLLMDAVENPDDHLVYFMSLDKVKWRRPVIPGDQIVFELEMVQLRRQVCKMRGVGRVDGQVVAEANLMARIVEKTADDE